MAKKNEKRGRSRGSTPAGGTEIRLIFRDAEGKVTAELETSNVAAVARLLKAVQQKRGRPLKI